MSLRFVRLDRPAVRRLKPGEKIIEHGITVEKLRDGDVRYTVAIMVDGRRIHRVIGTEAGGVTRRQAEEFIEKVRTEAREGRLKLPKKRKEHLTFAAAAQLYLKKLRKIGGKDYKKNEQHLRLHLTTYFDQMRLNQISSFTVLTFRKHCRDKGLADATVNRVLATYRRMGRRLHQWKEIDAPLPMIELEREQNQRTYVISDEEEARLLITAMEDGHPYVWLFIKLGLATSLRHGEMLSARFEHLDASKRRLRVLVKGGRWREQPLTQGITEILVREREMASDSDGWIFPSNRSRTGHIRNMSEAFARCVEKAGMSSKTVIPHIMRHTAITRLAETGADIKTIQKFSGHESLVMVLRYAHPQDRAIDRALDALEGRTVIEHPAIRKPLES